MKKTVSRTRRTKAVPALLLAAMLLFLTACGTKSGSSGSSGSDGADKDYIDLSVLQEIAQEDTFELKITDKSIEKRENQSGDLIKVTIANSGSSTASDVNVYYVAYAEDDALINWRDHGVTFTRTDEPYLCTCMPAGGFEIAPGESREFALPVEDTDAFADFEAIICSYKDEDGESQINDTAMSWEVQCVRGRYSLLEDSDEITVTDDASKDRIDPDVMRAIAADDAFPVKVVRKALYRKLKSVPTSADNCIMTVENGTTEQISDVTVYAAAYTQDGVLITFPDREYDGAWRLTDPVEPGKTMNQHFGVNDVDDIAGMCMIVASYKTADGEVHNNPILSEWKQIYRLADGDNT